MSITYLYIIVALAFALIATAILIRPLVWLVQVVESRHRRRHAARRRARAKGYVPVFDDRWEPLYTERDRQTLGVLARGESLLELVRREARQ